MIIKNKQLEVFREVEKKKFIFKSVSFLKENCTIWAQNVGDRKVRMTVEEICRIGEEYNIKNKVNLQKMMFYSAKNNVTIPLNAAITSCLKNTSTNEKHRVKKFRKTVELKRDSYGQI